MPGGGGAAGREGRWHRRTGAKNFKPPSHWLRDSDEYLTGVRSLINSKRHGRVVGTKWTKKGTAGERVGVLGVVIFIRNHRRLGGHRARDDGGEGPVVFPRCSRTTKKKRGLALDEWWGVLFP